MYRIICLILGYGIGCVQTAYILGRAVWKIDIREHGSGNAGATNAIRVMGPKAGLLVFACDILKGMAAYLLCAHFLESLGMLPGLYGGLGAVLGHNFPAQLGFKGGKGISISLGVIFWLDWRVAGLCYAGGILAVLFTRYISLASLIITGLLPVLLYVFGYAKEIVCLGLVLAMLAYYQHRGNISRLLAGNERKLNFKKEG